MNRPGESFRSIALEAVIREREHAEASLNTSRRLNIRNEAYGPIFGVLNTALDASGLGYGILATEDRRVEASCLLAAQSLILDRLQLLTGGAAPEVDTAPTSEAESLRPADSLCSSGASSAAPQRNCQADPQSQGSPCGAYGSEEPPLAKSGSASAHHLAFESSPSSSLSGFIGNADFAEEGGASAPDLTILEMLQQGIRRAFDAERWYDVIGLTDQYLKVSNLEKSSPTPGSFVAGSESRPRPEGANTTPKCDAALRASQEMGPQ